MIRRAPAALAFAVLLTAGSAPLTSAPTPSPNTAPSTDGGVSMSVPAVACDHPSPTGTYCYVRFRAVNVSDGFPVFTEADQVAYDPSGRAFRPDPAADVIANRGKPVTQRLLRGPVVSGVLVFDMPAGDRIDHLVLHGKPGTPGETFPVAR